MKQDIQNLIIKYVAREQSLSANIRLLEKKKILTEAEIKELSTNRMISLFWRVVIQDLEKIADKK